MQRRAVEAIGVEAMSRINQGQSPAESNITVNVSGNIMTSDFVEGELAEHIRTAVRRGVDFGVN